MTEMLTRDDETPLYDDVLKKLNTARDDLEAGADNMQELQDVHIQVVGETAEATTPAADQADKTVDPDMRTWGMDFVRQTSAPAAERPASYSEHPAEFDTSTLGGAQKYLLAVVAGKYGMQGTVAPFRYPGNARAIDERNARSLFGRLGSDFRTQSL